MTRHRHILSLIFTGLITILIILSGYNILAKAGKKLVSDENSIMALPNDNNDSYVFYSQADNDIVLFPWNYSTNATRFEGYYGSSLKAYDLIDTINLYDYLRYYFYRIISADQKDYIFDNEYSLSIIMDFNNLEKYLTVYKEYYFYNEIININNISYYLSVSFNIKGYIYSFQCREIRSQSEYTEDIMNNANSALVEFLNSKSYYYVNTLLSDIITLGGLLDNYILNISNDSYNKLNYSDNMMHISDTANKNDSNIKDDDSLNYDYSENTISYQLVKTQYEYLIIISNMSNTDIVLHYDPVSHTFNGFNIGF